MYIYTYLVGGFNHLEKYEFVNGKDDIPYIMEKTCLKPPASISFNHQKRRFNHHECAFNHQKT